MTYAAMATRQNLLFTCHGIIYNCSNYLTVTCQFRQYTSVHEYKIRSVEMMKVNSVSSNNSATSSETSETHSVEENNPEALTSPNQNSSSPRVLKTWKRMKELASEKESEAKRPPWRAVSLSTLPKPDKNALLRAKLLDASRRLRASKSTVSVQTDIVPTKLMKEVNLGAQPDLILRKEVGILTDGSYAIKRDGSNEYILTYSISQMTDKVTATDVGTQTLLPKVCNEQLLTASGIKVANVIDVEQKLTDQLAKISVLQQKSGDHVENAIKKSGIRATLLKPTLSCWQFDYDTLSIDAQQHFIPYTIQAGQPWSSFVPLPFTLGGNGLIGKQRINWYALLGSIDKLVQESNRMMDTLEQLLAEKRARQQAAANMVSKIPPFELGNYTPPSVQWLPIIEQQERELDILRKNATLSTQRNFDKVANQY